MLTLWVLAAVLLGLLVLESPPQLAPFALVPVLGSRNLVWSSIGGLIDLVWVIPLLVAIRSWHAARLDRSALAFGFAAGSKQLVWPIAPFLAIWLWNDADGIDELRDTVTTTLSWGCVGFLSLNLPFIVLDPGAWAASVLTPIAGGTPLVHQGVGPTLLSVTGLYALPKAYFSLLLGLALVVGLVLYALNWERVKWAAWVVPPAIFFWNYRSLLSYITYFLPVAYLTLLCAVDLRRTSRPTRLDIQEVIGRVAAL